MPTRPKVAPLFLSRIGPAPLAFCALLAAFLAFLMSWRKGPLRGDPPFISAALVVATLCTIAALWLTSRPTQSVSAAASPMASFLLVPAILFGLAGLLQLVIKVVH